MSTDHRFTGQKEDASGLQYFNARFYDPVIGMFVSPDTIVPQPGLASDYNRYLAFRGNPMRYTDTSGHEPCANNINCDDPLWQEYRQLEGKFSSFDDFLNARRAYLAYVNNPVLYYRDALERMNYLDRTKEDMQRLVAGEAYVSAAFGQSVPSFYDPAFELVVSQNPEIVAVIASVADTPDSSNIQAAGLAGFSPGKWLNHFQKHMSEFPEHATSMDYLKGANNVMQGSKDTYTFLRPNGERLWYNVATNEFVALKADGITLKTYFKPETGVNYWMRQTGRQMGQVTKQ